MSKMTLYCNGKAITVSNDLDPNKVDFLVDYGDIETFDVLSLTAEEASLFASVIRTVLGQEKSLEPKEKVKTT